MTMAASDATTLRQIAVDLAPELTARRLEIEGARRLPDDIADQLKAAGFHRMWTPTTCGGLELPPAEAVEIIEQLAIGDASAAWVAFIGATSGSLLAGLREEHAQAVATAPTTMLCGVAAPRGRAERVEGGFIANGRWQWGSGIANSDWVGAGCMCFEDGEAMTTRGGAPRTHMVIVPAGEVNVLDTWDASGLRGTGSTDFELRDVFVPDERVVGYLGAYPNKPLYQFPHFALLAICIAGIAMGVTRVAIDELLDLAGAKKPTGSRRTLAERNQTQAEVAQAEALLQSSRSWFYATVERVWESASDGNAISVEDRRDLRLATTHAVQSCTRAVDMMYNLGGGTSVYRDSRLQQCFRDIHVMTQHIMVGPSTFETVGRLYLGLPTNVATL